MARTRVWLVIIIIVVWKLFNNNKLFLIGKSRDHLDMFRKVRDSRIQRIAVETNRLLLRLEKVRIMTALIRVATLTSSQLY